MSKFKIVYAEDLQKTIQKLDRSTQVLLRKRIEKHLIEAEDPRATGKALTGDKRSYWRYRIGDHRLLCHIIDDELIILALAFGHRSTRYN